MDPWLLTSLLLCSYGFFKELRPSEPFLTEYLLGPWVNLTESQVYQEVYPIWTYSYLTILVFVFLVTDLLRYKSVIVLEGMAYIATWSLLLWGDGVLSMQFMQIMYGIATSTEVAYYTYIYAKVNQEHYKKVTSYTRAAILTGRFFSGLLSQLLYSSGLMDYHTLNYVSLTSVSVGMVVAICLPSVPHSIYFHREETELGGNIIHDNITQWDNNKGIPIKIMFTHGYKLLWKDFKLSYSNKFLLKWSVWWAFATCGNFQVGNYIQPMWETVKPSATHHDIYNGAVEASQCLLSAVVSFSMGYFHVNWEILGEITLAIISVIDGLLLYFMSQTHEIWVAYITYIIFRSSYQMLITVASYEVAKNLNQDSYGMVFGINTFLALLLQTFLTLVVADKQGLGLPPRTQFVVYGSYFLLLGTAFLFIAFHTFCTMGLDNILTEGIWVRKRVVINEGSNEGPPIGTTEPQ